MIPGVFAAAATSQGAPLWTPADLAVAPKVWVDWGSPVTDDSGYASTWENDRGSIGGNFSQPLSTARPEIIPSGPSLGKRSMRFDGANDYMCMTSSGAADIFRNTGAGWAFMVVRKREVDSSAVRGILYSAAPTGQSRFASSAGLASPSQNTSALSARRLDGDSTANLVGADMGQGWRIRMDEIEWSSGAGSIYLDGEVSANNPSFTSAGLTSDTQSGNNNLTLGSASHGAPPAGFGDVDLAAVVIGSGAVLSESDRQRMEGWAAWQCGLQDNLPAGHPYKSAPPTV